MLLLMIVFITFMETKSQKNVLDEDLELCSNDPLTGWYRDGCCNTDENDHGIHTVCAKVNTCLLYTSPSPRDRTRSRMPSSA